MNRVTHNCIIGMISFLIGISHFSSIWAQDDAISWFNRGAAAKDPKEKITCYIQAIRLDPKFIAAYYNLGYVYKNLGDLSNAEQSFRQALNCDPASLKPEDRLRINYELGITLKRLGRNGDAIAALQTAKSLAQQVDIRAAVLYELGRAKIEMGDFDGAINEFNEGLALNSNRQAAFEAAIQSVRALRELEAKYAQGVKLLNSGQYDEAIKILTQVINTNPDFKDARQRLAEAQKQRDSKPKTDSLADLYARGIGYMQRNDWSNALIALKQVEKANPNYRDVKAKLAEAQTKLDESLQLEVYDKLYNDALNEYRKGNYVNAVMGLEKVREWNPNYKNTDRIYRDAQSKLAREGEDAVKNRYYTQGKTYLKASDWQSAIAVFRQLKSLDPNYRDIQFLLQQAQDSLAYQTKRTGLSNLYAEAMDHFNNGNWLDALIAFEKIQEIDSSYLDIAQKITEVQNKLHQTGAGASQRRTDGKDSKQSKPMWLWIGVGLFALVVPMAVVFSAVPSARARWLLMQGNYLKAATIYESILTRKPDKVKLYPQLANIYLMLNRADETAQKVYDMALKMDISPGLRQRLTQATNHRTIANNAAEPAISLEEKLMQELLNLKKGQL
ncbi:MAG: tetratricopeptide repeat protein [candidate division KSB1 bacterium]|nr:tetratricopeptide repeat protein [candidate division KSB1 bacterium]MDZ7333550.1 tetratricopeptide repeat protein [candidate division KSB1 bacterium]MDZ7376095.1 tetratricopeptide repeat protein [candidate division KSB1 bacterium]